MTQSERTRARLRRRQSIVGAPTLRRSNAILARLLGDRWTGEVGRGIHGCVYFASRSDGATKIGFSERPAWRVDEQRLLGVLFILDCYRAHEQALHRIFESEHVEGEFFRGPGLDAFVRAASADANTRLGEHWYGRSIAKAGAA